MFILIGSLSMFLQNWLCIILVVPITNGMVDTFLNSIMFLVEQLSQCNFLTLDLGTILYYSDLV